MCFVRGGVYTKHARTINNSPGSILLPEGRTVMLKQARLMPFRIVASLLLLFGIALPSPVTLAAEEIPNGSRQETQLLLLAGEEAIRYYAKVMGVTHSQAKTRLQRSQFGMPSISRLGSRYETDGAGGHGGGFFPPCANPPNLAANTMFFVPYGPVSVTWFGNRLWQPSGGFCNEITCLLVGSAYLTQPGDLIYAYYVAASYTQPVTAWCSS